jgi:hypothetical protein
LPGPEKPHRKDARVPTGSTDRGGPIAPNGSDDADRVVARTRAWVEHAVIGLGLCPFARGPHAQGRIRYRVSTARDEDALVADLAEELHLLAQVDPQQVETTLLVHPWALQRFEDFNQFLGIADAAVAALGMTGVLQVASFHPDYRFEDAAPDEIANATNRSPYPTLHLLREDSVAEAVRAHGDTDAIYQANIRCLEGLGEAGWARLRRLIDDA